MHANLQFTELTTPRRTVQLQSPRCIERLLHRSSRMQAPTAGQRHAATRTRMSVQHAWSFASLHCYHDEYPSAHYPRARAVRTPKGHSTDTAQRGLVALQIDTVRVHALAAVTRFQRLPRGGSMIRLQPSNSLRTAVWMQQSGPRRIWSSLTINGAYSPSGHI